MINEKKITFESAGAKKLAKIKDKVLVGRGRREATITIIIEKHQQWNYIASWRYLTSLVQHVLHTAIHIFCHSSSSQLLFAAKLARQPHLPQFLEYEFRPERFASNMHSQNYPTK